MACDNKLSCPCTYSCERRGKCCECIAYHKGMEEFPACLFSTTGEKKYDRRFEALVEDRRTNY